MSSAIYAHAADALSIDREIDSLLVAKWQQACSGLLGARLCGKLQPELLLLLRGALFYLSSRSPGGATPGQALLHLHRAAGTQLPRHTQQRGPALDSATAAPAPRCSASRTLLYGGLVIVLPWAWARCSQLASDPAHPRRIRWLHAMRRAEACVAVASLLVTLRHLIAGGRSPPTLPMMLAGMHLVYALPRAPLRPAFDFMEQQLLWQTVADLMLAARGVVAAGPTPPTVGGRWLPSTVVEPTADQGMFARLRRRFWQQLAAPADADKSATQRTGEPTDASTSDAELEDGCIFCDSSPPYTPRMAPCGHRACYFCIASARLVAGRLARCPQCAALLVP